MKIKHKVHNKLIILILLSFIIIIMNKFILLLILCIILVVVLIFNKKYSENFQSSQNQGSGSGSYNITGTVKNTDYIQTFSNSPNLFRIDFIDTPILSNGNSLPISNTYTRENISNNVLVDISGYQIS